MAFQPIVNLQSGKVFAYEALVRGLEGEGAAHVLGKVTSDNRYAFDQQCRVRALELASDLRVQVPEALLSINFMPNAVYEPRACIKLTLATAARVGFPLENIIFEFTESEQIDTVHLLNILRTYKDIGFKTAIDDFGAGHSGLNLLARFQPDIVKLDMDLIRGIDRDSVRQTVVRHTVAMLKDLGVLSVCEGVETLAEIETLKHLGVDHVQGYALGRPAFEAFELPSISLAEC
ncbi:EAL domain-containing protein [Rhizobium paknamense]|uniref:EAL domain-containing protein (Putative c-di-GMP-specific phosphodiesterase class I) n=1 Tax=Rhizobium paknamense TaxID=1206817 RepID=A0ABU0ID95_9HYPH|nr:EAL domain-containing protein [Rhizobium paknamense]MDQ0456213.1 EAL domain-containing protein (putative c-di-GMP-specific phosphodiesterase class I) [Rhizobium paknamense]